MVEMRLADVRRSLPAQTPVLILQEIGGARRVLLIYIGIVEAEAIVKAIRGSEVPRPLTHDLFEDVLEALGATLTEVVITELQLDSEGNGTFIAELHLELGDAQHVVSARPSDAIALAARTGSPIFVADDLLDAEGRPPDDEDEPEPQDDEELVEQFHDFVEGLRPEDFAS